MTSDRSNDVRQTARGARVVDAHSRRNLLKTLGAGATAGIAGLAGCASGGNGGGGGDDTTTTTESSGGGDDGGDDTTTTEMDGDLADELIIQMSGGHYLDSYKEHVFNKFEEEFGVKITTSLVSNQFDGYSKIKSGQAEVDATITSVSTLYMGSEEDVWAEIDPNDVENYGSLLETFKNPIYDPGEAIHGIPAVYGTIGMAYNRDELGEQDSWAACWDTANEGRVTMEGFGFVRAFTTAMYLGMDPNTMEADGSYENGIEKIWDSVREQKPLVAKYWTSGDEHVRLFAQEQATVGEAWGGRIFGAVQDGHDFLDYVVPTEGAYAWSDQWVMVDGISEQKRRTVLTFMNFLLEEDTITPLTEMLGYPPATDAVSEGIKGLYDYDPSGGERLTFLDPAFKDKHNDDWSQTWEEIQSS